MENLMAEEKEKERKKKKTSCSSQIAVGSVFAHHAEQIATVFGSLFGMSEKRRVSRKAPLSSGGD